ncbi:Vicilin-like antimicrobial peptides 2-2 [Apostasia shenzhenica]|uniref:Vicilin-like antimicrobial peptides 2-2 n=1 Tax=Apostasia shenzhenica TaxID=1088818 RepID=A0A2I0B1W1_9ASPA|nr:Vicilin-like antimicrobial peptides 2-2 [Apostasia shenzhenica]
MQFALFIKARPDAYRRRNHLLLLLLFFSFLAASSAAEWKEWDVPGESKAPFLLDKSLQVVKTDGGEIRVVVGHPSFGHPAPMHLGFITMEPSTLLIPQYLDANLILFLRIGDAKVGWIHKDGLEERRLKAGDILRIPAGHAFYLVNSGKGQRLQIICSIDPMGSQAPLQDSWLPYQSFFIGGGYYPRSVLAGFDTSTVTSAFNATPEEVGVVTEARLAGPIIFINSEGTEKPHRREKMSRARILGAVRSALEQMDGGALGEEDDEIESGRRGKQKGAWAWTDLLSYLFFGGSSGSRGSPAGNKEWLDGRKTYGVVLAGSGTVEVVYPNGTAAMRAEVVEGDAFWVPRFFPFCQVAAREGPMEIFGFTTSARRNRPQFLVGARSVLRAMMGPELAAGFGLGEGDLRRVMMAQNESVILPSWRPTEKGGSRGDEEKKRKRRPPQREGGGEEG